MDRTERILAFRRGGKVKRCHTLPHLGEYTVGQHSFDAANLLLLLHPNPSLELVKAVLWHDLAESWVGDVPAPVLRANPEFREQYEALERKAFEELGIKFTGLGAQDFAWLKAVDRLEFIHWCIDQALFGNKGVALAVERAAQMLGEMTGLPKEAEEHLDQLLQTYSKVA